MTQAIAPAAATALTQVSAQVADLVRASKSPNTLRGLRQRPAHLRCVGPAGNR